MLLPRSQTTRPPRRYQIFAALGFLCPLALFAQAPGSGSVPDKILYAALFHFLADQNAFADRLGAAHKDDKPMRFKMQHDIGLTDAEFLQLRSLALDYVAQEKAYFSNRTQLFDQIKGGGLPATADQKSQGQALENQLESQRQGHMDQLKTALGPDRFKLVDAYARKEVLPHVGYGAMKPASKK